MNQRRSIRTDMAAELRRRQAGELPGVGCEQEKLRGLPVFIVDIFSRPDYPYVWSNIFKEHFLEADAAYKEKFQRTSAAEKISAGGMAPVPDIASGGRCHQCRRL